MKNRKKIKKIVLTLSATSGSLPFLFLPISQTNTKGSSREIDSKYMSYSQYNKIQDDGIYTNYNTIEGMFFEGWAVGNKKQPIYVGTNPNYSKNESGYDKSRYYINDRNNWYRLYDYDTNKAKRNRYGENSYNPAWDLLNPSLVLSSDLINTRYNWQRNNNQDSSFFNGDGWDSVNDTKSFRIGFNVDKLRSDDRKFFVGLWISEDLILTGNIKAILSTRNSNGQFQEAIANPQNVKVYNISVDEKYDVNDIKGDRGDATWYGKEENKYRINPWISKSYDYTGDFRRGDNHSGFKFYSSNPNNEYAQFTRYYVQDEGRYTTGKTWLNSMHYGSFYKTFPKEINQNIVDQYGKLWGGVNNDYFRKRTIANMIIHDEPSLSGDWKYAPVAYNGDEYKLGLFQKQYKDKNDYIYNSLNNNAGSLLILEIKSEDESTAGFTPSLQLEFTVKRNPNTIDNNGVRSGNNASPLSRDASSKKTYIGFGQFKYEFHNYANRQFGSFMKMADRQAYQNIKFNTTEKLVKSEYLLDNDKLPNTTLSLIEDNNGSERTIHSVNKSKYNEVIKQDKILAEYKTKNNVDSLTQYSNINNLRLKTEFVNPEDKKKWKIVSENSYSVQNPDIFSFNTTDDDGYLNFNEISYDLTDYEKLKRFANDRTKNEWLTIKQIDHLLSQIEEHEDFDKTKYSFNNPKWFNYYKEQISNLNTLQGKAEEKRAELRNLVLSTSDKVDWNNEISNKVLFAFADQREVKGPALKLLEWEGYNRQESKKYNLQSDLNKNNSEATNRNDKTKVLLQNATEVQQFINDVDDIISKIKSSGKTNLENEFINTLNSQNITKSNWSQYNYLQGTKFIIAAINSVLARYNTPYDLTSFNPTTNLQYKNDKTSVLDKVKNLSTLYDAIQNIQTTIQNLKNDDLVYGKTTNKPAINDDWYNNFVQKLQNANNIQNDASYAFYSQNNLDTFKTNNANNLKTNWIDKILELNGNKNQFTSDINSFTYLDSSVKQSFIQRIPTNKNFVYSEPNYQLTDNRKTINDQLTTLIEEAFTQAKTKAKEKINSFSYVSQTLKNTALNSIDSAQLYKNKTDNAQDTWVYFGNDKNLKTIVDELEKQNNYHKELFDYLESNTLNGKNNVLTQKQKDAFKNDILSKNFADQNAVDEYKKSINNVNDATQNLKNYVTNLNTNTDKYNFASPDKKRDFDAYKMVADSLVSGKSSVIDASKITKLQSDLTNAYNALDGDSFINKIKRLNYLTENLQNLIINQIKAADPNQRQAIYEKAKTLNDNFGTTDLTLINTYNSAKSNSDYTNGSKARKSAFDSALTSINTKLNTSKNKLEQPTSIPTNYTNFIEDYISQYNQLKSTIATAYNNLDGNEITAEKARLNAISLTFDYPSKTSTLPSGITESIITNNLSNNSNANVIKTNFNKNDTDGTVGFNYQLVSTDSKFDYLPTDEKIKSDIKPATINGFLTLLEQKRLEVIKYINDSSDLIQSEKTTLKSEVNSADSIPALEAIHEKAKIWELSNTVKTEYSYLNNNQIQAVVDRIRAKTTLTEANTVFTTAQNLNGAMKNLHDKVIEELKVLIPNSSLNDNQNKSTKTAIDYKLSDPNKQSAYDQALKNAQDLLNKTSGENKNQSEVNGILSALNTTYTALNGDENRSDLHSKIEQLSHLSVTQKQDLKDLVDAANSKADAQTIYEKGKLLNDKIAEFKQKITDAERVKATEAYTEDTTANQRTFDSALSNAKSELATLQSESLSSLNASAIETKANDIATKTITLNNAIEALDGYRNKVKKSLDNWEYLTSQQVKDLQDKVDSKSKKPTDDEVNAILSEGLHLAKNTAKTKITSDIYPNLSTSEINTYKGFIDSASLTKTTGQKYDKKLKDFINQAAQDNKTKQNAIDAINTLDALTQAQKNIFINSVKAQVVAQSESIKNEATELDKAIQLLNEEALRELKILSENDALTTQNMFAAAKTANKYELANKNLKDAYEVELAKVQGLLTKVNVTKSEIDNAKTSLKSAFNALNGDTKLTEIEKEIDKLNNLSDDQKEQIKNLVTNADTQEKANQILEKAKELNKAIGDLKAKIEEAKNTKQDPIYSSDTSDKKSAFDNAITESETKLDEHLKVNLGNLSAEQILEKAKEVQADIKTLDDEIKKLDGKKQALRDEINAYSPNLISEEEKKSYIERIDVLDRTNPDSNQANQILSDAFNKAKEKAKEIVNALDNLSDADKKTYTDALTNASKGAASAPDSNLKSIIEQAKAAQKTKQDAIDRIKELSNLTPDQKSELEKQIKEGTTSDVADIEKKANDLNNAIPEAKNEITAKENSKNTINYKWADDNLKTLFDEKLKALKDLIASKDATAEQIKAAEKELQDAADALNGDQKHAALDNRIDQLSNINETRRNELKEKIKTLDNYSEAEKLVTNAESLNEAIQKLKDKIAQAENTKNQEVYTLDSDTKKNEFNEAINSAKEELKAYQDTNLTTLDDTAIKAKKTEIVTKVTNLQGEIDKLDGYRHAFKESLKDKWNLLTDNDFNTLNSMIDDPNFKKNPQDADKQTVLDKGLELAKNNATAKLIKQNYPNLSDADLQALKNEVNVAILNSNAATTDTKFDDNVKAVLNKASQQNQEKQAKIAEIQKLSNLNQSQKDALVQEVKDSLHSQAENVLEKAKTLDTKMKQLKDKVAEESTNKALDAYQNASEGVKKAYENSLENAKNVINNQPADNGVSIPANADATQVDQLISALDTALVDIKKDAAKNAIDNLNNLSKTEKNEYKNQIDQANTPENVETIKEKAKNANDKKQEYIDRINQTPGLSEEEKQDYINRIKETKFDSSEANNEQKFENIVLDATKQGLKNQIDGTYTYLNPKQKEDLKNLIDSKTTIAKAQEAFNSYSELNEKMKKLKDEVIPAIEVKVQQDQNKKHSKATATTKDVFDTQLTAAKDLLTSSTNNGESTLDTFIANVNTNNSLENLFAKLDGEIVVAKEKINDKTQFANVNKSEIEKLSEKLDAINLLDDDYAAQISKVIDQASVINTAKQERINQINSLTNLSDETSDTKPVSEKQAFINEAKDTVLEINANANPISITEDSANALDAIVLKAQKQDLINQINGTYEHLNPKQKQDLISAIQDANDLNTAQNAFNDVASVNTDMKSLKDIVKEFTDKDVANLDDYKFASDPAKQHYDDVFAAAKELINSSQNNGSAKPSLTTLIADNTTLGSVKEAFANLDGLKNKAIKAVKALDNLNTTEVQKLSDQINNVSNTDENKAQLIDEIVAKANEYNQAKADTIAKLNKLTDLTEEQLKDYVKQAKDVEFTDTDQNPSAQEKLDKILDNAKKQGYKNLIDQLNSINQNQKDAYKARIDNAQDEAAINQILEEARAYDELKAQADALKVELDNYKNTIDYRLSEDEFKTSYDDKLTDLANEINGQSHANDLAALQELVKNAQQSKEALNGIEKNSEIAQAIEKLKNLSTKQQTELKTLVEAQNSLANAQTIKQNATDLNTKLTELKAKLTDANEVKSQPIYLLESQNEQDALNNAITQADQLLSNVQNTQFNQNNLTNLATLAQDAQAKTESLNNAIEQLNGVHKDLIAKIDEFELLTPEEKTTLKETVKTFDKNLTKEQVLSHLENYLENSKSNAQTQVAELSNLSEIEKDVYKQKLKNAGLKYENSTNPDWLIQAQDENNAKLKFDHDVVVILKQAQADNAAKQALIDHINNDLVNLTQNQKATLVNKVKAADASQVADLTKYANDLDKAMLDYKNKNFGDIKNEIDYTQASSEKQKAFDVQLENQKNNTDVQNGADFDLDTVKAERAKLIAAREALDGEERLAEAKAKAKAKVNNEYNNLSDAQKVAAKNLIDKQNTIADVEAKDVNHSALNSATELLNKHISEESTTKADIKYTGSEAAKRQAYDDAIAAAKELQAKLQESNTVADELLNTQAIQDINNRVQSALDALNGEQNMQKVRNEANNVIDSLEELNQAQKDSLKQTISKQTTPEAVAQETAKARELDAAMKKLNDVYEVELTDKTKESVRYINADENLQKNYDDALLEAAKVSKVNESQTNKKTALVDIEAVKKLATNLENAKVALNGDEKLNEAHNDAEEFINNLQHLNDAQKAELIKQAKVKDSITQTQAIKDKAQKLDNAMKDLKDAILTAEKELQANPVKYDNADQELKDAYNQIAKIAKDLVAPSGENKDQNAVETIKNSLIDAKNALNGDVKFAKDKNDLIDQIIQNPDLTPIQKDKLVEVVNQASNSDELEKAKELFDTMKSKMEELRNIQKQAKELQNSDQYANASVQTRQPLDQDIIKNDEFLNSDLSEPVDWAAINDQIYELIVKTKTDMANLTQEAQDNLDQAKESALAYLDDLSSLNNAQLDNFKDQINTANWITDASDSIESIKEIANSLNDLMSKLNDYIENVVESANNVDPRTSVNYINADQELKDNFDASYANATTLVDKELGANLNFDETNDVYLKLKKDFEALNGEQNKRLNAGELEKLVNKASEFVQKAPYTTSTPEKQKAYNVAIEDGKKVLENLENVTVEEIKEAIDKIKDAIKQIYDNKDDLKNIVDELPNLSEQEKEHFKDLIQNEEDPVKRDEILREAQKISDQKQELINLINEQPNLSYADKEQLRDKVVNADSSQENWYDKLKDDINKANELIKKLVDEISNHTLNNEQLDQLIKDLADAGVTNPDYDKIVDGLKKYNDLTNALTNYRNSHVLDENYQDLKDALVAAINETVDFAVTHEELSKLKDQLVSQKEQLNQVANGEMNLVDSLINKDQSKFDQALNSINQIISDKYSEFNKELNDKNYFEITNKPASQISENDINLINSIEQKDASEVIYSALQEALKTKSKADNLSIFWWILLGLFTAGIGPSIYFLTKKSKKDEE